MYSRGLVEALCKLVAHYPRERERERERGTDGRREELREICREVIAQKERQLQLCRTHFEWRKQRESLQKIWTIGRKEICTTLLKYNFSLLSLACSRVMNKKRRLTSRWVMLNCFRGICPCRSVPVGHTYSKKKERKNVSSSQAEWKNEWMIMNERMNEWSWMNEWKKKGLGRKRTSTCSF